MDGVIAGKWSREGQWMNLHRSEDEWRTSICAEHTGTPGMRPAMRESASASNWTTESRDVVTSRGRTGALLDKQNFSARYPRMPGRRCIKANNVETRPKEGCKEALFEGQLLSDLWAQSKSKLRPVSRCLANELFLYHTIALVLESLYCFGSLAVQRQRTLPTKALVLRYVN